MIAIGVGCRRGASRPAIVALIQCALARSRHSGAGAVLCTIDLKQDEAGLVGAADELKMPIRFYSHKELNAVRSKIATQSPHVQSLFGIGSVCEAAALAGAGKGARLLVERVVGEGVACAVAHGEGG